MNLAYYYESKGLTKKVPTQESLIIRFTEFKKRLMNKSLTLTQLEESIIKEYSLIDVYNQTEGGKETENF